MIIKNNARSNVITKIESDSTTFLITEWEQGLFLWEEANLSSDIEVFIEAWENKEVIKREPVLISSINWNLFTISQRAYEECVQNDTLIVRSRTQNPFSFDPDIEEITISMYFSENTQTATELWLALLESDKISKTDETITKQWNTFNEANKLLKLDEEWKVSIDNLPVAETPKVDWFKKNLTAWENINALICYRKWSEVWEFINKYYKSLANDTTKLNVEWIVNSSVLADWAFDWTFDWIVWWFTWLIWQDALWADVNINQTTINSQYEADDDLRQSFTPSVKMQLNSITLNKQQTDTWTNQIQILDWINGSVIATSDSVASSTATNYTFNFSISIILEASTVYQFKIIWWTQTRWSVVTSNVYVWGSMYLWTNIQSTKDMYFLMAWQEIEASESWFIMYLQDDWTIWFFSWTNEVVVWKVFSDTEIELINRINWKTSTTATTGSISLWNAVWYITQNIPWLWNVKIPYYNN